MSLIPLLDIAVFLTRLLVGGVLTIAGLLKLQGGFPRFLQSVLAYDMEKSNAVKLVSPDQWVTAGTTPIYRWTVPDLGSCPI